MQHRVGDAAEDEPGDAMAAPRSHEDQVRLRRARLAQDHVARAPEHRAPADLIPERLHAGRRILDEIARAL